MKKIVCFISLICGMFGIAQETTSEIQLKNVVEENSTSVKPLVFIDDEADLQSLHKLDESQIESITLLKGVEATALFGSRGKVGVILVKSKENVKKIIKCGCRHHTLPSPLYIVDGKEFTTEELNKIIPERIDGIEILKGEEAVKKYGEKAKGGVIIVKLK